MTAERLLTVLWRCTGAAVSVSGDRLRVEAPPGVLTPSIREALAAQKADLLRLLAAVEEYRVLLHSDVDDAFFLDAQARLIDELGPVLATAVRQAIECGQPGLRHA
jgi:TubC N-terminal docking domain